MKVEINNKEYQITKLPLGRYVELVEALDTLPSHLGALGELSEENILKALPKIIRDAFPEIVRVVSLGSGIDEATIKNDFGLVDFVKVVKAIFEVNEFKELGKVLGGFQKKVTEISEINNG